MNIVYAILFFQWSVIYLILWLFLVVKVISFFGYLVVSGIGKRTIKPPILWTPSLEQSLFSLCMWNNRGWMFFKCLTGPNLKLLNTIGCYLFFPFSFLSLLLNIYKCTKWYWCPDLHDFMEKKICPFDLGLFDYIKEMPN